MNSLPSDHNKTNISPIRNEIDYESNSIPLEEPPLLMNWRKFHSKNKPQKEEKSSQPIKGT